MIASTARPNLPAYLRTYTRELARMRLLGHSESFAAAAAFSVAVKHLTVGGVA